MFNFFKKKKKKVHEKWFLFIVATVAVALGIGNELFKGTSAVEEVPANSAFDDMSFYMCVVDAYNDEKPEDAEIREYTDNLTDEELAIITYMNCSAIGNGIDEVENIKSTKGIEKLVSLVELQLFEHDITSIDLSNNLMLEDLYLKDNQLTEINISGNTKLMTLYAQNNKLTNIDVSNNVDLTNLDISGNQITSIDVSNNVNLLTLSVNDNKLTELDLTNNNKLKFVFSTNNVFCKMLNVYKGEKLTLESIENVIKLPSEMSLDLFSWLVWDLDSSNIITVDNNGVIEALSGGVMEVYGGIDHDDFSTDEEDISYVLINNTINVIDISSEEYIINKEENFVYTGNVSFDVNKINVVEFDLNVVEDKLQVLYENTLITELDVLNINFGTLTVSDKIIEIVDEMTYEDFTSNITKSEGLSYKILNEDEEVIDTDNIVGGEEIEIYYNDILLDSYEINVVSEVINEIVFNDNLIVDEDNSYIKYKKVKSTVSEFLTNVTVSSEARMFVSDIDGNEKTDDDIIVTGDKLTVFAGSEKVGEYLIAVRGDANGDGRVSSSDLVQVRKHIVGWKNSKTGIIEKKTGIYFYAIDMNDDGKISSSDLVRVRKVIVGIDIDG